MNKTDLISGISKYYLSGKCKDVRWEILDKNLFVDFLTDDGGMLGTLELVVDLDDAVVAMFNTDRLLSVLNALGDADIQGQYKKTKDRITGIAFTDGIVNAYFTVGEMANIPDPKGKLERFRTEGRVLKSDPKIACEIKLEKESINRFLKAKKAISDAKIVATIQGKDSVDFVINYSPRNENKITVPFAAITTDDIGVFQYNVEYISLVLTANDGFRQGNMSISTDGLMIVSFKSEDSVTYYIKPLE